MCAADELLRLDLDPAPGHALPPTSSEVPQIEGMFQSMQRRTLGGFQAFLARLFGADADDDDDGGEEGVTGGGDSDGDDGRSGPRAQVLFDLLRFMEAQRRGDSDDDDDGDAGDDNDDDDDDDDGEGDGEVDDGEVIVGTFDGEFSDDGGATHDPDPTMGSNGSSSEGSGSSGSPSVSRGDDE